MGQNERAAPCVWAFAQAQPTRGARVLAVLIACALLGASLAVLPVAGRLAPAAGGMVAAPAAVMAVADLLTAYLLWSQARATYAPALGFLCGIYAGCGLLVSGNVLLFRRIGASGAAWLWAAWHLYFVAGMVAYAFMDPLPDKADGYARARGRLVGAFAVALIALAVVFSGWLPPIMRGGSLALPRPGTLGLLLAALAAVIVLAVRRRASTVLDLWLLVTVLAMFCDFCLVLIGHARDGYGWYLGRFIGVFAALAVLGAFFYEMNRIHIQLLRAQEHMLGVNSGLLAANSRLSLMVEEDELTKVLSRRAVLQVLEDLLGSGARQAAVLMIDLDHFKKINDRLGHLGGDAVLREAARRIRAAVRGTDVVGRYGGEEFLVVLPAALARDAKRVADGIVRRVRAQPIVFDAIAITVTASAGIASARPGDDVASLLRRADKALYQAKDGGRDRAINAESA